MRSKRQFAIFFLSIIISMNSYAGSRAFETYGDVMQIALPVLAGGISFAKQDTQGIKQLLFTTGVTLSAVYALKYSINAERPNGGDHSFPSGHTAGAFIGASYLHYRYGWQYGFPSYIAAGLVGYSRVNAEKHYWHDVIAGAAIANVSAYFLTDKWNEDVQILPWVDPQTHRYGLQASVNL